ncbi:MAG: hypothetical protein WA803_21430 [Steroidobacteraceae bacterium]
MRRKQLAKHLDKRELISSGLLIKYHSKRPPDKNTKRRLSEAAGVACSVMRKTVWEIDKVCLFYRDERDLMTRVLDAHFGFKNIATLSSAKDAKNKLVNAKARRNWLGMIRRNMLSISFHLNTGMYLLDTDAGHRTIVGDNEVDNMSAGWSGDRVYDAQGNEVVDPADPTKLLLQPKTNPQGKRVLSSLIEAYAQTGTSGPVHVSFELAKTFSPLQFARLIVHEASHTFCGTTDVYYAHAKAEYYAEKPLRMITNADSYAYAAVSIASKTLHDYDSLQGAAYTS